MIGTTYAFVINYQSMDNLAPEYIFLCFPSQTYHMKPLNLSNTNYKSGVSYYIFLDILRNGTLEYYYLASDGYYEIRGPKNDSYEIYVSEGTYTTSNYLLRSSDVQETVGYSFFVIFSSILIILLKKKRK